MGEKQLITAQDQLESSFRLGAEILRSGFRPNRIVALWRGGAPVGMAIQELFAWCGIETDHIAIRTQSYTGVDQRHAVEVSGLNYLVKNVRHTDRLLIVDDVFDTGHTIDALITQLEQRARRNTPEDIRVAVPWYKPANNRTTRSPDYYLEKSDRWLCFPHEIVDMDEAELREAKPAIWAALEEERRNART